MRARREHEAEGGFTLVELLLSIAVLVIIVSAVSTALIVFLKSGREASRRDDQSLGAATAASYLNRDLASARTASTAASTTCSGKSNQLVLTWVDYTASTASPSPAPSSGSFTVAYTVSVDSDSTASVGTTRYQLERWYCAPGTSGTSALLARDLNATTDFSATSTTTSACPGGQYAITLKRYGTDVGADYLNDGCLKGRIS